MVKIKKLCEIIVIGGKVFEVFIKNMEMVCQYQMNEGMFLFDLEDEFEIYFYFFVGLFDLFSEFKEDIVGVVGIFFVCLFCQLLKGFLIGDVDFVNYYDDVGVFQE